MLSLYLQPNGCLLLAVYGFQLLSLDFFYERDFMGSGMSITDIF